jgi:hypothetical protein
LREITQALWEQHGLNLQNAFEVNNPGTIPVEGATLQRTLTIAWHRGSYLSQAERLFRDFVVDYCARFDLLRAKITD